MTLKYRIGFSMFLAFAFSSAAWAQKMTPPPQGTHSRELLDREELRARVQQKTRTYLSVELSTRAGLDDVKTKKLAEVIGAHLQKKAEHRKKMKEETNKLRELVEQKASDAQIKAQLGTWSSTKRNAQNIDDFLEQTAAFLTPTEQAKVALALPDAMRGMRDILRDDDDDDDDDDGPHHRMRERMQERREGR